MALEGLRDLSVIATAPQRRLAIKTFVRSETSGTIREAVLRELKRGGQVYFLHNEVETIQARHDQARRTGARRPASRSPTARCRSANSERVMRDFVAQRHNVLLCSTIIETGIDVPTANTIVMSRADKFGLAQLHQLRGRVGRSHHQAYAYLLVPDVEGLTKAAAQRLDAIQSMEELGSGFYLAMHDLEIRGAGEVLGDNQSGNMMEVGFQLYNEMLAEAVRSLKAGVEPDLLSPLSATTEINLHAPALLPDAYCGDVHARLSLYKRLASANTAAQIDTLLEEVTDRFGKLPPQGQTLFDVHRLRVLAKRPFGVTKIDAGAKLMVISLPPQPAGRRLAHHRAGAEEPPHQARRQRQAAHRARHARAQGPRAIDPRRAACARQPQNRRARLRVAMNEYAPGLHVRGFTPPLDIADFRLIAFDMDSTLINIECIDEIADAVGQARPRCAAITEATMRGEIHRLQGKPAAPGLALLQRRAGQRHCSEVYDAAAAASIRASETLGRAPASAAGPARCLLVSGGFTFFSQSGEATASASTSPARTCSTRPGRPHSPAAWCSSPWGDICRRRREAPHAARGGLRPARHLDRPRPSRSATAPTTCR